MPFQERDELISNNAAKILMEARLHLGRNAGFSVLRAEDNVKQYVAVCNRHVRILPRLPSPLRGEELDLGFRFAPPQATCLRTFGAPVLLALPASRAFRFLRRVPTEGVP